MAKTYKKQYTMKEAELDFAKMKPTQAKSLIESSVRNWMARDALVNKMNKGKDISKLVEAIYKTAHKSREQYSHVVQLIQSGLRGTKLFREHTHLNDHPIAFTVEGENLKIKKMTGKDKYGEEMFEDVPISIIKLRAKWENQRPQDNVATMQTKARINNLSEQQIKTLDDMQIHELQHNKIIKEIDAVIKEINEYNNRRLFLGYDKEFILSDLDLSVVVLGLVEEEVSSLVNKVQKLGSVFQGTTFERAYTKLKDDLSPIPIAINVRYSQVKPQHDALVKEKRIVQDPETNEFLFELTVELNDISIVYSEAIDEIYHEVKDGYDYEDFKKKFKK